MAELENQPRLQHPLVSILLTLLIVFVSFQFIGPIFGFIIALPLFEGNILEITSALQEPLKHPELKNVLFIMQGSGTLIGLILVPALMFKMQRRPFAALFNKPMYLQMALLVAFAVISFMAVNAIVIQWNQEFKFPEIFSGFEKWARSTEDQLAELTKFLTKFESIGQVFLAFIVIAVIPAVGEEIVFRGMIQQDFYRATKNMHVAIWMSAILFSAFHLQFYGFLPRMLLGAMFGYLYYWSGNLVMAMIGHFVNNGFTVIALYLYQQGSIDINVEDNVAPPLTAVLSGALVTSVLLFVYKKFYENRNPEVLN